MHRIVVLFAARAAPTFALLAALASSGAAAALAQTTEPRSIVGEARLRRDAGDMAGAVDVLRPYVVDHPDELEPARLLAQTLYWLKDPRGARELYEATLARHPGDVQLRVEYGRMLVETLEDRRAREVLTPLLNVPDARGRAEAWLGTAAYWNGDYSGAQRLFVAALRADSAQPTVRRQLREIASVTAPWVHLGSSFRHDDQPINRLGLDVEAGWFPAPLTTIKAQAGAGDLRSADSVTVRLVSATGRITHYAPGLRFESELTGGILQRDGGDDADWTGRLQLGVRMPRHMSARARAAREPYFYTVASLTTPLMTRSAGGVLAWSHPRGWLGEAAAEQVWYPDTNAVRSAHVWMLAPLARGGRGLLQLGYGASAHDARESRFALANPRQPFPPGDPRFRTEGRYTPYYTPANLVTQSLLAAVTARPASAVTLRLGGSYGVWARDDAPVLQADTVAPPGRPTAIRTSYRRSFSPWTGRGSIELASLGGLDLSLSGEVTHTVYYTASTGTLGLTYRFTKAALRRVERY